uniref:Kinesin motor domain-containing protein n=1 Tax=Physcomitrium patens TaxID=3218 RepID=A0A7I4DH15_PHYPA
MWKGASEGFLGRIQCHVYRIWSSWVWEDLYNGRGHEGQCTSRIHRTSNSSDLRGKGSRSWFWHCFVHKLFGNISRVKGRNKGLTHVTKSIRSHTIFTLCMEKRVGRFKTEYDTVVAKLNLVDLAGFERLKKTNTSTGGRMRVEACSINKSLCLLEQAVYAIKQGQEYVPFRQSKISIILKEALSGNCRTELILCLWPEEYFLDETIKASRFAQRLKVLRTFSIHNKKIDCCVLNERRHAQEIANLQQELALKDALQGRPGLSFDDLTLENYSLYSRSLKYLCELNWKKCLVNMDWLNQLKNHKKQNLVWVN